VIYGEKFIKVSYKGQLQTTSGEVYFSAWSIRCSFMLFHFLAENGFPQKIVKV
jgi:hypothetical protein